MSNPASNDFGNKLIVRALEEQNKSLEEARRWTLDRVKAEWDWPKRIVVSISFLAGGFAIFTFINQYFVISEISSRSKELSSELGFAREAISDAKVRIEDADSHLTESKAKLDVEIESYQKLFDRKLEEKLDAQSKVFKAAQDAKIRELERAHRVLALIAMGNEQLFLKKNPQRALLFAASAREVFEQQEEATVSLEEPPDAMSPRSTILAEVYPAIWNLEMECLVQTRDFSRVRQLANQVLLNRSQSCVTDGKYCSLRQAFYYRGLAGIDEMSGFFDGLHPERAKDELTVQAFSDLKSRVQDDLGAAVGSDGSKPSADRSIGSLYRSLLATLDGNYKLARGLLRQFRAPVPVAGFRPTLSDQANTRIAVTILEVIDFIEGRSSGLEPTKCSLASEAISPWDAYLLEQLVQQLVRSRSWHIRAGQKHGGRFDSEEASLEMGKFCVSWILSLRFACLSESSSPSDVRSRPETGAGCGDSGGCESSESTPKQRTEESQTRAELMADLGLSERVGGVLYNRDRSLGREYRNSLWMKVYGTRTVHIPYKEEVARSFTVIGESGVAEQRTKTDVMIKCRQELADNPIVRFSLDESNLPAAQYVMLRDEDIGTVNKMIEDGRILTLSALYSCPSDLPMAAEPMRAPAPKATSVQSDDESLFGD